MCDTITINRLRFSFRVIIRCIFLPVYGDNLRCLFDFVLDCCLLFSVACTRRVSICDFVSRPSILSAVFVLDETCYSRLLVDLGKEFD